MSLTHLLSPLEESLYITGTPRDEGLFLKEGHGMGRQTLESLLGTWACVLSWVLFF